MPSSLQAKIKICVPVYWYWFGTCSNGSAICPSSKSWNDFVNGTQTINHRRVVEWVGPWLNKNQSIRNRVEKPVNVGIPPPRLWLPPDTGAAKLKVDAAIFDSNEGRGWCYCLWLEVFCPLRFLVNVWIHTIPRCKSALPFVIVRD